MLNIADGFHCVGEFEGYLFFPRWDDVGPFKIAVFEVGPDERASNEARIIEIGIIEGAFHQFRAAKVGMQEFRALEGYIAHFRAAEGAELRIDMGKVAGIEARFVEKAKSEDAVGKKHVTKAGADEGNANKSFPAQIETIELYAREIHIAMILLLLEPSGPLGACRTVFRRMIDTCSPAGEDNFLAGCRPATIEGVHFFTLLQDAGLDKPGYSGFYASPSAAESRFLTIDRREARMPSDHRSAPSLRLGKCAGSPSLPRDGDGTYYKVMCSYCGSPILRDRKPGFNETCESCGKDLHACMNCRFYKPGARFDCAETIEEPVVDKSARNRCDWYETNPIFFSAGTGRVKEKTAAEKAKRDLDSLFGG